MDMETELAGQFDNPEFSDMSLELIVSPDPDLGKRKRAARHIHCTKIILGCGSPKFKQRLLHWEEQSTKSTLAIEFTSEEAAQAVESLVKYFYTKTLPADASPPQLLQLMVTSNEYQSRQCTEACARHLEGLDDSSLFSPDLLLAVFQLPPFLLEQTPDFQPVVERATRWLKATFKDLDAALKGEDLQELFVQLPAAAVQAFLGLDDLAVSDITVLLKLLKKLQSLDDESSSHQLHLGMLQLPPLLLKQESEFRGVVERAVLRLKATFQDMEAVWQQDELRGLFLQLPAAAVAVLLGMNDLGADSENTVLLAVLCWLEAQPGEVPAAVRAELVSGIRLQYLSPAYWAHVVPHFRCIAECVPAKHLVVAQALAQYSADVRAVAMGTSRCGIPDGSSLRAPSRSGTTNAARSSCRLTVSLAQLQREHKAAAAGESFEHKFPVLLRNGFQLSPKLKLSPNQPLGYGVYVSISSMPAPSRDLPLHVDCTFKAIKPSSPAPLLVNKVVDHIQGNLGWGFPDYFSLEDPADLASFAEEDQVTVEFEVHSCQ